MGWWETEHRDPFLVCAKVDDNAESNTMSYFAGKNFGFEELSQKQRDDLLFGAVWDSSGAYQMAGMTYRLVHERSRWRWILCGLLCVNTALLLVLLLIVTS